MDQWQWQRDRKPTPAQNGAASPGMGQTAASADEAETGVRYRRKTASLLMNKLKSER